MHFIILMIGINYLRCIMCNLFARSTPQTELRRPVPFNFCSASAWFALSGKLCNENVNQFSHDLPLRRGLGLSFPDKSTPWRTLAHTFVEMPVVLNANCKLSSSAGGKYWHDRHIFILFYLHFYFTLHSPTFWFIFRLFSIFPQLPIRCVLGKTP